MDGDVVMGFGNDDVTFGNICKQADYLLWKLTQEAEKNQEKWVERNDKKGKKSWQNILLSG